MSSVNWDVFASLPGSAEHNFEMLCRALVRRHYGQYGQFRALANQPGVEFHLNLQSDCVLGKPGRWYGWQCRWYDLPSGRALGTTRRAKIAKALKTTQKEVSGVTDWVLWTRYPLTKGDQKWFFGLSKKLSLHAWTATEVEEHLSGPAEILRGTYFGDLVLTGNSLNTIRDQAVARIRTRWRPEVHQTVDAERDIRRILAGAGAWTEIHDILERLRTGATATDNAASRAAPPLSIELARLVTAAKETDDYLATCFELLKHGNTQVVRDQLLTLNAPDARLLDSAVRRLRSARHPAVLVATNLLADVHAAFEALWRLRHSLTTRLIALVADAGCGKTHLSAEITAPSPAAPPGIPIFGADLAAGNGLDDLAKKVVIQGRPAPSFEALVAALDAAGERATCRLPLVIDGLNEAEDPRDWKTQLASLDVTLQQYSYVCVICTLRSAFVPESLPDDTAQVDIPHFDHDTDDAVRKYFSYYKIDPTDAALPWELLQHPLTLRIFCEVTNPNRTQTVGVGDIPDSLTPLLERYLDQAAGRIADLSPRSHRYYASDVRSSLNTIGLALWEDMGRSIPQDEIRTRLSDHSRPWNASIVRLLEENGVVLRDVDARPSPGRVAIAFDLLAGYIIADALYDRFAGPAFESWLNDKSTLAKLRGDFGERHPLADDIFRAFVGLTPRRLARRQLWQLLDGDARTDALRLTAWLEARYLDVDTVSELASLIAKPPGHQVDLLDRLTETRSAGGHPLNAEFLDRVLRPLSIADRDLRWSEWIRVRHKDIVDDLLSLTERWSETNTIADTDHLRLRWSMWLLTSSVRTLRDHATHALYRFGCCDAPMLFALVIESLEINDPYVPERMLAAAYGVAMSLWADPRCGALRDSLPQFAKDLIDKMWAPKAPHATWHALMQDYSLGLISLACHVSPGCISEDLLRHQRRPFTHIPSPFPPIEEIDASVEHRAAHAINMDFGNYTIGGLIENRRNYDDNNTEYQEVRRQIEHRILELGYSSEQFSELDRRISDGRWRSETRGTPRTDRYGKKYSWIAYFEMFARRFDQHKLPEWRDNERPPDAGIDPSFPAPAVGWNPRLPDPFASTPTDIPGWLRNGPTPDYTHLLELDKVDSEVGPWMLLDGFIEQTSNDDGREIFTFLRGVLVAKAKLKELVSSFESIDYPGNHEIPDSDSDHYTFAGEIPWSVRFGRSHRDKNGKAKRNLGDAFHRFGPIATAGVRVEIPIHEFAWESHHSELNQAGGATVPAPALCQRMKLMKWGAGWDFYDQRGRKATVYRKWKLNPERYHSDVLYVRKDLLKKYLKSTRQVLVWLMWGERGFDYPTLRQSESLIRAASTGFGFIHRRSKTWEPR